jgi:hypothetical protein
MEAALGAEGRVAFIDEAMRQSGEGLYLVAAAVVVEERRHVARDELRKLLLPRQVRFHWRSEPRRLQMLELIGGLRPRCHAYVHQPTGRTRQVRARALCLHALLWDLKEAAVDRLVIESRQDHNDRKDRQTIIRAQRAGIATETLRYSFEGPKDEPLLWLPDAIAGAAAASMGRPDSPYPDLLRQIGLVETRVGP